MNPLFSVIMPVWNRAGVVDRAIESVLSQTLSDWELIIIDDGSSDGLEDTLSRFRSDRIRYRKTIHGGAGAARNEGLRLAGGRYMSYLDSDNAWHRTYLVCMSDALQEAGPHRAAYCRVNEYRGNGKGVQLESVIGEPFDRQKLLRGNYIDLNGFVHERDCLSEVGWFDENLTRLIDWDFILRVTSQCSPLFVEEPLVDYFASLAANRLTTRYDVRKPFYTILDRYLDHHEKSISFTHDAIRYDFSDVSEKKYKNFLRMSLLDCINEEDFTPFGYPFVMQIEPTNLCNLSCTVCPAAADKDVLKRERRHMNLAEFTRIIDDMQDYLLLVVLWDWGEPFLNPVLPEMIRYAHERGIEVVTSTNAHFLNDPSRLEPLLRSGLSTLIVAIDSIREDPYTAYRRGGDLPRILNDLRSLVRMKRRLKSRTRINWRMVLMKENESEIDAMRDRAFLMGVDHFTVKTVNPSCGGAPHDDDILPEDPDHRRYVYVPGTFERVRTDSPCRAIWTMSNIHSNGVVVPCTYDFDAEMAVGNVSERPFTEIWKGDAYRALRREVYREKMSLPKCRDCDTNFALSPTGWFVESHDFSQESIPRLRWRARILAKEVLPQPVLGMAKSLRGRRVRGGASTSRRA